VQALVENGGELEIDKMSVNYFHNGNFQCNMSTHVKIFFFKYLFVFIPNLKRMKKLYSTLPPPRMKFCFNAKTLTGILIGEPYVKNPSYQDFFFFLEVNPAYRDLQRKLFGRYAPDLGKFLYKDFTCVLISISSPFTREFFC
jgi:hypothetical protein